MLNEIIIKVKVEIFIIVVENINIKVDINICMWSNLFKVNILLYNEINFFLIIIFYVKSFWINVFVKCLFMYVWKLWDF